MYCFTELSIILDQKDTNHLADYTAHQDLLAHMDKGRGHTWSPL